MIAVVGHPRADPLGGMEDRCPLRYRDLLTIYGQRDGLESSVWSAIRQPDAFATADQGEVLIAELQDG